MSAYVLAHLSDPHLAPLPQPSAREIIGKRVLGYLNWTRNRHTFHLREALDGLIADVKAQKPDHIAITGDFVNISLDAEFKQAIAWLRTVGTPDQVSVIPGNHDAYVAAMRDRFASDFADYLRSDGSSSGSAATFPYVQRRGPLAIIGLSTAVPTAPFMATGKLGTQQLDALEKILAGLSPDDAFRVLLIHHPLDTDRKRRHKRLKDAEALAALLRRRGVDLVLHGHDHRHATVWLDGINGKFPVVGVPSASAADDGKHDSAAYNLFEISREADHWRCDMRVRTSVKNGGWKDVRKTRLI
ncbi:MAG: metallophosphatase [Proteobacteria bacterium SG_bin9]|nr:MAG: metallophosphatase [Proteobacteria bacterium SG_bin9]